MIVVDSSVWIDLLNDVSTPQVEELEGLIRRGARVSVTGLVYSEVLQGLRDEEEADRVAGYLLRFPSIDLDGPANYIEAARLYRQARSAGVTISSKNDLLVAVPCIRTDSWLLHNDRDFDRLAEVSNLKIWRPLAGEG